MPQLNVLFRNVGKKDLTQQIVNLTGSREVDILVLVENLVEDDDLVRATDGVNSLVTEIKRPHKSVYSDHLPLFFTLRF
jgi:hypothetical protein